MATPATQTSEASRPTPLSAAPTPEKKSPRRAFLLLGIVVAALVFGIGGYTLATANQEDTDDAQVEGDVIPIAPRVGGQVIKVTVTDNQRVKKGDLLLQIDDADYSARAKQAEAELATMQAQAQSADAQEQVVVATARGGLSSARAGVSGSSAAVASAQASLLRAQADAHKAELDLSRDKELFTANAVPKERLDNATIANDSAQAALQAARAMLDAAQTRVQEAQGRFEQMSPIDAQIAAAHSNADLAHARVKSAEAALELARNQLSYTKIFAATDGFVSKLSVHEGQLVQPGMPAAELVPAQTYVVANYKETQVGLIKPGQKVEIKIDAFPGRTLEGKVDSLSGGTGARFSLLPPDNASGNFVKVVQRVPVRIAWTSVPQDLDLRAGLSADVTVYTK